MYHREAMTDDVTQSTQLPTLGASVTGVGRVADTRQSQVCQQIFLTIYANERFEPPFGIRTIIFRTSPDNTRIYAPLKN
jgi:hypothetical protein